MEMSAHWQIFVERLSWCFSDLPSAPMCALQRWHALLRSKSYLARMLIVFRLYSNETNAMYAQGLQMGQALRNVVLSPANDISYKNLAKAQKDFDVALKAARVLVINDSGIVLGANAR